MRVAMLSRHDNPRDARIYYKESRSLQEAGHEVIIVQYLKGDKILRIEDRDHDTRFHPVRSVDGGRIIDMWKSTRKITEAIYDEMPDAIHCHDLDTLPSGVRALKKCKVPLIFDVHEDFPKMASQTSWILGRMWSMIQNRYLPKVDRIIIADEIVAKIFGEHNPLLVRNYPPLWFGELGSENLKETLAPNGEIIVLYHGCLNRAREPEVMIEVARRITKKYDAKFLFVGRIFDNIKIPESGNIKYLGSFPWLRIPSFLRAMDIGFCAMNPTKKYRETMPTKIFECMLFSKPFVGNEEFPMVSSLLEEVPCGTPSSFNVDSLVSKLSMLIENGGLRKTLGVRGRRAVENRYNWEMEAKKLVDLYDSLGPTATKK